MLLDPVIHIGKDGASDAAVASATDAFRTRELIKVRVLKNAPEDTAIIAVALAEATQSTMVGKVGFTFLLYRPNSELRDRIELPRAPKAEE
jgi:RNA-binding protein